MATTRGALRLLVALATLWGAAGSRRADAQPCVSCWDATCPAMKSYGQPACPETPGKKGGGKTHPVPPAASSGAASCPAGQERGPDTQGRCCWPGQVWDGRCVGLPTACPEGMTPDPATQACALRGCAEGRVRASDGGHCCWAGQAWSKSRSVCVGVPTSCPGDLEIVAAEQTCRARPCPAGLARGPDGCPDVVPWVRVPAGTFQMGPPGHRVGRTVAAFEIGRTEVTVASYEACVATGTCTPITGVNWPGITDAGRSQFGIHCNARRPGREQDPVNCVDWAQARAFCAWAGGRLPTEAEWEYAARGPDGRAYPWGDREPTTQLCWKRWNGGGAAAQGTCPVGANPAGASPFGAQDMAGNANEWVEDAYDRAQRVFRGGAFDGSTPADVLVSNRWGYLPDGRSYSLGFRCARDPRR